MTCYRTVTKPLTKTGIENPFGSRDTGGIDRFANCESMVIRSRTSRSCQLHITRAKLFCGLKCESLSEISIQPTNTLALNQGRMICEQYTSISRTDLPQLYFS